MDNASIIHEHELHEMPQQVTHRLYHSMDICFKIFHVLIPSVSPPLGQISFQSLPPSFVCA